ncbi:MAG TPA: aspartyl/asparaginyl beta-hydroxylase domain-containing protein [Thermoanaerobaculia bacterium]|nr:aspartyl/asparaginyl beta-hydroxylase domain-containing protein [Thermoanaerobaculia bacterium]
MFSLWLATKLVVLALLAGCALYIHFRGRVRHGFVRQLTDHSTFLAPYNVLVTMFSAVPRQPIQKVSDFPELAPLRENWQALREEAERLEEQGNVRPAPKHNDVAFNAFFRRGWTRFYVKWYGEPLPSAEELTPKAVALVKSIPSINAALFARLPPRGVLGEHRDPFAGSLRYHLGLRTPNSDACRIYIDGTPYSWRDGEDLVFDETYIHSVTNDTDEARLILFCDVARPIRNPIMRAMNRFVTRHIVRITAAQNFEGEQLGAVNRVSGSVYRLKVFFERAKNANRRLYYAVKYLLIAALVYATLFR